MRQFSVSFRLWHWLNAIVMVGIFITVLLRESVMDKHSVGTIIQTKLGELGTAITEEQAIMIAKAIRAPMWDWHIYLGIAMSLLLVWRLAMVIKNGFGFDDNPRMQKIYHLYRVVYAVLAAMSISGLMLYLEFAEAMEESIESLHSVLGWGIFAFIALHVVGVVLAERSDQPGLVSRMISGK